MADISVIKLPNSSSYNVKDSQALASAQFSGHELTFNKRGSGQQVLDLGEFDALDVTDANVSNLTVTGSAKFMNGAEGLTYPDLKPIEQKVYESTSQYATAASNAKAAFFFMSVKPYEWNKPWTVRFKVRSYCPSYANYDSVTYATWSGSENNIAYANWNQRAYYYGHYYLAYYPLTQAGFNAGYGHAIAINLLYASSYTSSAYYRTFEVEYYECENCIVTILDSPVLWENWTGGNTTNYGGIVNTNAVDRGLQETGDANSTSISTLYNQYGHWTAGTAIKRYEMLFSVDDRHLVALNELDNQYTNTAKQLSTTTKFDPLGKIYYYNSSGLYNADATIDSTRLYYSVLTDMRYTFNISNNNATNTYTCTVATPCYLKVSIGTDGMATIADAYQPLTSTLPSSPDGYYYIYLGRGYDWYRIMLSIDHPVYCYTNNGLERYLGNKVVQGTLRVIGDIYGNIVGTINGHTVATNVPAMLDNMVNNFGYTNDYAEYFSNISTEEIDGQGVTSTETSDDLIANCKKIQIENSVVDNTTVTTTTKRGKLQSNTLNLFSEISGSNGTTYTSTAELNSSSFHITTMDMANGLLYTTHFGSDYIGIQRTDYPTQGNSAESRITLTAIYENGESLQSKYLGIGAASSGYNSISVNGNTNVWLRVPQPGLIPYTEDSTNGNGSLGTTGWPFQAAHIKALTTGNIEMQPRTNTENNGGWIDFHYNKSTADYTTRIIEPASGILRVVNTTRGNLQFYDYSGTNRAPTATYGTDGRRLASTGTNASGVQFLGQWGTSGTTYSERTIAASSSDVRLKKNIEDANVCALDVINQIRMRQFDWKESGDHWDCGMVVDEMEKDIDPKFCIGGESEDGISSYKSVNTFYLQGYEVKAIQELSKENEDLKKKIQSLEERLEKMGM